MYEQLETKQLLELKERTQETLIYCIKHYLNYSAKKDAKIIKGINKELKRRGE